MAKKRAPRNLEREGEATEEPLLSRSDSRRKERELEEALARLAKELVELRPRLLEKLMLPEELLDTLEDTRAISSAVARNRQLRLVRTALRGEDWSSIRARVDALRRHGSVPEQLTQSDSASPAARAPEWVARLLGGGRDAIEALVEIAPTADRAHLADLVERVRKASAERRVRAEQRLTAAVTSLLRAANPDRV